MASCIQPPPSSSRPGVPVLLRWLFTKGEYIGWLPVRRGFKTACVGVGVALGWPLANQQPPVAGHPRPTWSTSPNIHIDLVVLADRRANPLCHPPSPHPLSSSTLLSLSLSLFSFFSRPSNVSLQPSLTTIPRRRRRPRARETEREGRVPDQRVQGNFESKRRLVFPETSFRRRPRVARRDAGETGLASVGGVTASRVARNRDCSQR